jgi:hypothetical protein
MSPSAFNGLLIAAIILALSLYFPVPLMLHQLSTLAIGIILAVFLVMTVIEFFTWLKARVVK